MITVWFLICVAAGWFVQPYLKKIHWPQRVDWTEDDRRGMRALAMEKGKPPKYGALLDSIRQSGQARALLAREALAHHQACMEWGHGGSGVIPDRRIVPTLD